MAAERKARNEGEAADGAAGEEREGAGRGGERTRESGRRRVLHARISDELHEALLRAAEELRVPVSNLVRNALEDVFTVVDTVSVNVRGVVERAVREAGEVGARIREHGWSARAFEADAAPEADAAAEGKPAGAEDGRFAHVAAWQQVILNAPQSCANCDSRLERGTRAFFGVPSTVEQTLWLCRRCLYRMP